MRKRALESVKIEYVYLKGDVAKQGTWVGERWAWEKTVECIPSLITFREVY